MLNRKNTWMLFFASFGLMLLLGIVCAVIINLFGLQEYVSKRWIAFFLVFVAMEILAYLGKANNLGRTQGKNQSNVDASLGNYFIPMAMWGGALNGGSSSIPELYLGMSAHWLFYSLIFALIICLCWIWASPKKEIKTKNEKPAS